MGMHPRAFYLESCKVSANIVVLIFFFKARIGQLALFGRASQSRAGTGGCPKRPLCSSATRTALVSEAEMTLQNNAAEMSELGEARQSFSSCKSAFFRSGSPVWFSIPGRGAGLLDWVSGRGP